MVLFLVVLFFFDVVGVWKYMGKLEKLNILPYFKRGLFDVSVYFVGMKCSLQTQECVDGIQFSLPIFGTHWLLRLTFLSKSKKVHGVSNNNLYIVFF